MDHWVTDMMGRAVLVPQNPVRIISLVPSQTEFLYALGLRDQIAGVTKFCVHPADARTSAQVIGGTKQLKADRILRLQPDLVIGNKEENDIDSIQALEGQAPVWMSDIYTLSDAYSMMIQLGDLVRKRVEAECIVDEIKYAWQEWMFHRPTNRKTALYFIWANPWMAAARSTFIDSMMEMAGFDNVLDQYERYPELNKAELTALDPEVVLLSSEPFPFKEKHKAELRELLPNASLVFVDGEMFSWYGSRLALAPAYLKSLL